MTRRVSQTVQPKLCPWFRLSKEDPFHWQSITMMSHEHYVVSNHRSHNCLFNSLWGPTSKKHQSPHYWPFVRGIQQWPVNVSHKGPIARKKIPFDDVIMNLLESVQGYLIKSILLGYSFLAEIAANSVMIRACIYIHMSVLNEVIPDISGCCT